MTLPIRPADRPGGLLTGVVGSHARPSWLVAGLAAAERGEFGPVDLEEMHSDAVDVAIRDQESAGIDVVSDGEMRRAGFFTARVLPPPDRRPDAAASAADGRRGSRPAAHARGPRADHGTRRPRASWRNTGRPWAGRAGRSR